jgi:hypothetical protein
METVWLFFTDETHTVANAYSPYPQDFPNPEEVRIDDPRYAAYYATQFSPFRDAMPVPVTDGATS